MTWIVIIVLLEIIFLTKSRIRSMVLIISKSSKICTVTTVCSRNVLAYRQRQILHRFWNAVDDDDRLGYKGQFENKLLRNRELAENRGTSDGFLPITCWNKEIESHGECRQQHFPNDVNPFEATLRCREVEESNHGAGGHRTDLREGREFLQIELMMLPMSKLVLFILVYFE